jgi:hypothetical protein
MSKEYSVTLCPRLQHLTLNETKSTYHLQKLLRFLFRTENTTTGYLFSLCIKVDGSKKKEILHCIYREHLIRHGMSHYFKPLACRSTDDLYLWW